jgi:hypothetical protein
VTIAATEIIGNRNSTVDIVATLHIGPFAVRIPAEVIYFVFPSKSRPARANLASFSMGTRILSQGQAGQSVKFTNHLHLYTRLRMSGAIPLLALIHSHSVNSAK